jgi:predicted acetyltransferase
LGGNIGYAVSSEFRGRGYGSTLLRELLLKADEMGVTERILTVEKYNYSSRRVIEKNGGVMFDENDLRWFFRF